MSLNFALLLFVLLVVTGVICLYYRYRWKPARLAALQTELAEFDAGRALALAAAGGAEAVAQERERVRQGVLRQPWWIEYSVSFFPVILFVFVLRSFVVEPFRIPSGSMIPTLQVGDLILVSKFSYGIRLPIIHTQVVETGTPQRGDVMVFRYPVDPSLDYIKRVVAVPGDEVAWLGRRLFLNGQPVPTQEVGQAFDTERLSYGTEYAEILDGRSHRMMIDPRRSSELGPMTAFPGQENCRYTRDGVTCRVPDGHFFVMGDNRDNSLDSRFWGFVPEDNIVGKAFFIWMNFGDLGRIGRFD